MLREPMVDAKMCYDAAAQQLRGQLGDDWDRIKHMSIIDEDGGEKCATV